MDAMIFSAGLGTRLAPLTDHIPKALIDIGGIPILEHIARRLVGAGVDRIIINTHPHAEMIREFVRERDAFGVDVVFSHEPDAPLDTAGGLRHARHLFRGDAPFFLHNCDVLTTVDLAMLYRAHGDAAHDRMATLAVLPPSPERYLMFDDGGLCGYAPRGGGEPVLIRETAGEVQRHGFSGIHVASPALLDTLDEAAAPNIISQYLRLARSGASIERQDQLDVEWVDIGTREKLEQARQLYTTL